MAQPMMVALIRRIASASATGRPSARAYARKAKGTDVPARRLRLINKESLHPLKLNVVL